MKVLKKLNIFPVILLLLAFCCGLEICEAQNKLTAQQVAQKAAAVITGAKGLTANFTMSGNGRSGKGVIKSSGNKFSLSLPDVSIWYNGKSLYTYNGRTSETTITTPTGQELLESNPLLYVKGGSNYNYSFNPVKRTGKYIVDLTPTNKKNEIKKITFTVNSTSFKPERIAVTTSSGVLTLDITNLNTAAQLSASDFEYPKSKYPKAEIVDLR